MYAKLTEQQKREFIEVYLKYREDGRTKIFAAYKAARMELSMANKPAPGFSTFETWLRQGRKRAAEVPREEVPETAPEVPEETAAEEVAEEETSDVSDLSDGSDEGREDQEGASSEEELNDLWKENRILRSLLRIALAYAGNEDLNNLADRVIPDLLPEA